MPWFSGTRRFYVNFDVDRVANAFWGWRFGETNPYTAEELKLNIVGSEEVLGRDPVVVKCDNATRDNCNDQISFDDKKNFKIS